MSLPNSGDANNGNNDSLDPSFALGASDNDTTSFFHQQFNPTASNTNINPITNGPPSHQYPVAAAPQSFSASPIPTNPSLALQAQQGPTGFSAQTAAILARAKQNIANHAGSASYEAAREQLMKGMVTSDQLPVPASGNTPKRGRGGRGRGGRGGGAARSPTGGDGSTPGSTSAPASERGRGKVGRPRGRGRGGGRGGKRKRSESPELSDGDDDEASEISESYTPLPAKTKSGRAVNKPTQYVPVIPEAKPEGKKRRPYRRNIEAAVCKMCNRGTSPSTNQIVFCDGCGTPYHQYCHDPPIESDVVEIPDKEWFCSTCVKSKESAEVPNEEGMVTGDGLSAEEKRTRLSTLPQARLLDLLIQASSIHPDLAIFPASISMKTEESIAPAEATASAGGLDIDGEADATAEPYDGYDTDPPAHYPKAGNGVARTLRPEAEDLQWLVDENTEVFSHETNYLDSSGTNGNGNGVGGAGDTEVVVDERTERQKAIDAAVAAAAEAYSKGFR